ncbi:Glycosyltransferase involved in cell wall bisynthesis [Dyella jiangningensis]|uniref:glycosyltransferase family 4 protein n=1 Tax=Dyella sp. AtDHG13 TaxID=1938897 RepID=UPI00088B05A9|nr:glycosyltransferase family 4 protein [Dyella sp. AtDHG13]PXV55906.1 glycosyltransferase involved in cell wall biosynthesis [Dyella sp. AtDHG13]SDK51403.1 Glycosyltransferase involved in cell wall bisynthesis [Dyella jiangningensis]
MRPLHVAQINFHAAPAGQNLADTLARWPSLVDIAESAASAGARVTVIQRAAHAERLQRGAVDYRFIASSDEGDGGVRAVAEALREQRADVLHAHSLGAAAKAHALSRVMPGVPILLQDHADRLPSWWKRPRWRRWYASARGVAFTAPELARPYVSARLFGAAMRLFAIPESTSRFTPGSLAQAWAETGLYGNPCVVWVGHLQTGKDPLTVLAGFAQAAEALPQMQLWCAYGHAPLLAQVQQRMARDPRLKDRVHLLGRVPHERVQSLMRAADIFVSGSRAESCGYALLEAMACGATPVVTRIPSFLALVGEVGRLWSPGDANELAQALIAAAASRPSVQTVRDHFERHLSLEAIGRRWVDAYGQLIRERRGGVS